MSKTTKLLIAATISTIIVALVSVSIFQFAQINDLKSKVADSANTQEQAQNKLSKDLQDLSDSVKTQNLAIVPDRPLPDPISTPLETTPIVGIDKDNSVKQVAPKPSPATDKPTAAVTAPVSKFKWQLQKHLNKDLDFPNDSTKALVEIGDYLTKINFEYENGVIKYTGRLNATIGVIGQDFKVGKLLLGNNKLIIVVDVIIYDAFAGLKIVPRPCRKPRPSGPGYSYVDVNDSVKINLQKTMIDILVSGQQKVEIVYIFNYSAQDIEKAKSCNVELPKLPTQQQAVYGE